MRRKKPKAKETPPSSANINREAVTRLAYELYLRRGGEHGHDVEDWLMAEQILVEQKKRSGLTRRASDAARRFEDKFSGP
jgi:hypothetical protein